ncbi:Extracellular domains-containing protein [Danaus plexippus plexippus]|uniref:Extracellular domains-containing protein n=1 Tax=Danaus plexippus plexippus TaxID=278856 RepID=A0A212FC41_DANPL|nr:Extracellular domains-containing protein [Danaus plexippus plexippus]
MTLPSTLNVNVKCNQEYSARTLGATWGIISAVMIPIVIVLICIGWRVLKKRKEEENDENEFMPIKTRSIDPDESFKINSDDESIPYKKDINEDSPEPTEAVKVSDIDNDNYPYNQQYQNNEPQYQYQQTQPFQTFPQSNPAQTQNNQQPETKRAWSGETEIN